LPKDSIVVVGSSVAVTQIFHSIISETPLSSAAACACWLKLTKTGQTGSDKNSTIA